MGLISKFDPKVEIKIDEDYTDIHLFGVKEFFK